MDRETYYVSFRADNPTSSYLNKAGGSGEGNYEFFKYLFHTSKEDVLWHLSHYSIQTYGELVVTLHALIFNICNRRMCMVSLTPRPLYFRGNILGTHWTEAGLAQQTWSGRYGEDKNPVLAGIKPRSSRS